MLVPSFPFRLLRWSEFSCNKINDGDDAKIIQLNRIVADINETILNVDEGKRTVELKLLWIKLCAKAEIKVVHNTQIACRTRTL